jgi:hypothetical protein
MSSASDSYPLDVITVIHIIHTEKTTQRGVLKFSLLKNIYSGYQVKKDTMSLTCVMSVGRRGAYILLVGERDHVEDLGVMREYY